ncbi:hypothetical protein NIES2101_28080 [Calothrix sp. HK-06]|nr:hypothetical protein NIES2101_28080 [Calothrix sp. HK-06]
MTTYKCTRNKPYIDDVARKTETSARQGHYIEANSIQEAIAQMEKKFPNEKNIGFTAEEWED